MRGVGLAVILAVLVVGCDRGTEAGGAPAKFRVAMILPGSDTDKGWNQMAREGLDRIRTELSADAKIVTNVKSSEFGSQIGYFADEGYDLIICHGGEFKSAVESAAKRYPKTRFIVGGCDETIAGATPVEFLARDASYLVGVVAADVSKSKQAAFVGAMPFKPVRACYDGMRDGIAAAGNGVKLMEPQWTNSWDSPTLAKERTELVIGQGADVIYQNVDAAARGVFDAVAEAAARGKPAYAFGCNSNQNDLAPGVILGSVVLDIQRAYLDLAREAKQGKLAAEPVKLGLRGGYVDLVLNDRHAAITDVVRSKVAEARQRLLTQEAGR